MSLLSLHHQDAAQALFELRSAKPSLAAPLPGPAFPSTPATTTSTTMPLFILPNLSAFSVMAATSPQQHQQHQQQQLPLLSTYLAGGNSPFFPSLLPLSPSPWPMTTTAMMSAASPAPTSANNNNNNNNNNQRLSVSYLLNNDDSATTTLIKQEPDVYTVPSSPASSFSSSPSSSPKRKATSRPPSTSLPKEKRLKAEASSSVSTTTPPSSASASASPASSSQLPQATSAVASAFKGDLSLFPHLQLQLQREQLDPQQHTELVLKVWNRQQQVLKLQQLQHKKQELKAQRLQQRSQRKSGGGAAANNNNNKETASPASPLTPPSSSPSSPSPGSSSSPSSPTTGPAADVVSALPTLDDILNGADVQVDEASDEEAAAKGQKKPRRRISARQVAVLEQVFAVEPFPGPSTKKVIAKKLGMKERSITIWFQNKRARLKRIDNEHKEHHESESGGKREVTFHNLAVGFDGKLDMLPEDH